MCRRLIDAKSAVATRAANSLTYHFCSEEHARAFDADRLSYLYCPVFKGSRVDASISAERDGETYYFCCVGCRLRFLQAKGAGDDFDVFGVRLALDAARNAIRVDGVVPGSPAARAGIEAGMTVVAVDGQAVDGPQRFLEMMGALGPGRDVELGLRFAAGEERTVTMSLGQRPQVSSPASAIRER